MGLIYSNSIRDLNLNTRTQNALERNNISRICTLVTKLEDGSILYIRNIGRVALHQICDRLNHGMYSYTLHPNVKEFMRSKQEKEVIRNLKEIADNLKYISQKYNIEIK